jgi:predicted DNA-binding transcriptional regulator YafY
LAAARRDGVLDGQERKDDIWYLVAGTEAGQRAFRLDRVVEAEVTDLDAGLGDGA